MEILGIVIFMVVVAALGCTLNYAVIYIFIEDTDPSTNVRKACAIAIWIPFVGTMVAGIALLVRASSSIIYDW